MTTPFFVDTRRDYFLRARMIYHIAKNEESLSLLEASLRFIVFSDNFKRFMFLVL